MNILKQRPPKKMSAEDQIDAALANSNAIQGIIRDGTIKHSKDMDFTGDFFKRSHETHPGFYIMYGSWKGPFADKEQAREARREWVWEAKHG